MVNIDGLQMMEDFIRSMSRLDMDTRKGLALFIIIAITFLILVFWYIYL